MTTFSIIVPVYKAEKYISQCIESILNQTFCDFEVLCVDDCGGDNSMKIIEEYAKKDSRIVCLYNSHNKGVGATRNLALQKAKGKYILCVDSDDWIDQNTLKILLQTFITKQTESVWFNGFKFKNENAKLYNAPMHDLKHEYIQLTPENLACFADMCGMKAYTLNSIKKIKLQWPENIKMDEDGEFYFKYYIHYPIVYSIPNCLYYYRQHNLSLANQYSAGKSGILDTYKVIEHIKDYYIKHNVYEQYKITLLKLLDNRINFCKNSNFSEENKKSTLKFLNNVQFPLDYKNFAHHNPLVSVVVPVYNVENYVKQCLQSIINQSYTNIEILCIDDCGQDNSMKIVNEFAQQDNRIQIIKHTKNRGLGGARNSGLQNSKGEYILFIDSDDWIQRECINIIVNKMNYCGLNSAWFKADFWMEDEHIKKPMNFCQYFMNMNEGTYILDEYNISNFPVVTWNKAYRTKFLKQHNLSWRENIIYEDVEFYWKMFTLSPYIYIIDEYLYFYRQRSNSIMHQNPNNINKAKTAFFVVSEVFNYLKQNNLYEEFKQAFLKYACEVLHMFDYSINDVTALKQAQLKFLQNIASE